jgi:hypothetical protein
MTIAIFVAGVIVGAVGALVAAGALVLKNWRLW